MQRMVKLCLLLLAVVNILQVLLHAAWLRQQAYWWWPWRHGPVWPLYPAMLLAALPLGVAVVRWGRGINRRWALALVALSLAVMPAVGLVLAYRPTSVLLPAVVVEDRGASSYWSDARLFVRLGLTPAQVLQQYPLWLPKLSIHTRNKPPGFVLFYYALLRVFGPDSHGSAIAGAIVIALGTAAGVWAIDWLAWELLGDADAAFLAAVLFALTPSVVDMFPQFDSCFPALVAVLSVLWLRALRRSAWYAAAMGLMLAVALLCTSNLLVMGTFFLALAVWEVKRQPLKATPRRFVRASLAVVATVVGFYLALWLVSGYNPIATMRVYLANERQFETLLVPRPWPQIVPSDFYLFVFGTGYLLPLLAMLAMRRRRGERAACRIVSLIGLGQILLVGCTGLLRGETTRYWCFLIPLLTIPAGCELARWPRPWRLAAVGLMGVLMLAVVQNVELNSLLPR